jgi:hypothetical protein
VLVATTVNTPDPLAIGLEMFVLFKLPVAGGVQEYVNPVPEAVICTVGEAQVVLNELGDIVVVGTVVF